MTAVLFTWGRKEQAPMARIAGYVAALPKHQRPVYLTPVTATGDDSYGLVVSDVELTPEQARQLYLTPDAVVRVEVSIEPSWAVGVHTEVIDVALSELIGLEGTARENAITEIASDYVNNVCSWGAHEVETVDYPDDTEEA